MSFSLRTVSKRALLAAGALFAYFILGSGHLSASTLDTRVTAPAAPTAPADHAGRSDTVPVLIPSTRLTSVPTAASAVAATSINSADTLRKIRQSGRIALGYRETAVPFSYVDSAEHPMGLSWALCSRVVSALRREPGMPSVNVLPVRVTDAMRSTLVAGRSVDIDCAPASITAAREQQVAFSLPYYAADIRLMVQRGSGIGTIDAMRGKRLVVAAGTTAERLVRGLEAKIGFKLMIVRDYPEAFRMLQVGRAQAMAFDDVLLAGLRATSKAPDSYRIVGEPLATEQYALVLPKNDPALKALVDGVLADLFRSGEMAQLQKRWFQAPTPPHGTNLRFAPSEAVKAIWAEGAERVGTTDHSGRASGAAGS